MEYIGWIPCINGHLDFGLMRPGIQGGFTDLNSKDENAIEINTSLSNQNDCHDRFIVLQSKVDWRDSDKYDRDSGKFRVTVTAKVNKSHSMDERCLDGNVLIYPLSAEPKEISKRHEMNVHILCHSMSKNESEFKDQYNKLEMLTSGQKKVDYLTNFSCSIHFKIEPNGIIRLKYNENNPDLDNESIYIFARQAFYYLKYSLHIHKHHLDEQDSLTTITPIYSDGDKSESDAGLRLICQLKRELTSITRIQNLDNKEHPTNNALGIIAYTKSLISSLEDVKIIDSELSEREKARFENVKESIAAQNGKISNEINNVELVKSKSKIWLGFLLLSIWGSINFNFKSDFNEKIAIATDEFLAIILASFLSVFFIYLTIKRYYLARFSSRASKNLYDTKYWKIVAKILVAVALITLVIKIYV
jgi:hypothetical protein